MWTVIHLPLNTTYLNLHKQYDVKPTRRYHSALFNQDSLDTEAIGISSALKSPFVFNVPPDPHGPTAACSQLPLLGARPLWVIAGLFLGKNLPISWFSFSKGGAEARDLLEG